MGIIAGSFKEHLFSECARLDGNQRWEFVYESLAYNCDFFCFSQFTISDLLSIKKLHAKELTKQETTALQDCTDNARFEYYESLNSVGEIAYILTEFAKLSPEQTEKAISHLLNIADCNFHENTAEMSEWKSAIEKNLKKIK